MEQRDRVKQGICTEHGITLIVIPYWWDKKIESVAQTIYGIRPDVDMSSSLLIGEEIPKKMPTEKEEQGKGVGKRKEKAKRRKSIGFLSDIFFSSLLSKEGG